MTFLGAAGTVTGSRFLVDADDSRVLVDAGLFQGLKALRLRNWQAFPVAPASIDGVVLTHAHLDHCGYLPALARDGLDGPVLASRATLELARIVLADSAALQEEDATYAQRGGWSKHSPPRPLYDRTDVDRLRPLMRPIDFGQPSRLGSLDVRLTPAGHILGSAVATVTTSAGRVVLSGDLGRPGHPLLREPPARPDGEVVLVESTYGNRRHASDPDGQLADALSRCLRRGGVAIVPAFAVDRTEVLLLTLRTLMHEGRVPSVPVFVDSPMALAALQVYRDAVARGDPDVRTTLPPTRAFDPGDLREVHDADGSRAINDPGFPCIIVSASGMATGGRVVHHLKHMLPDPQAMVVLVGFQAVGTRGRSLLDGARTLRMHGRTVPVRAEVVGIDGFSVHADTDGLLEWLASASAPRAVYVVHGEPSASAALAARIRAELGWLATVPDQGQVVGLDGQQAPTLPA